METITGRFDGKVFVPDDAVDLPTGQRVSLHVTPLSDTGSIQGVPGSSLLDLAGAFSKEDAEQMLKAIDEDCERIESNGW